METQEVTAKLNALAQEARLKVFRLLMVAGSDGLSAGLISEQSSIPPNTLSFHLIELQNAELIDSERQGRSIIYSLNVKGYGDLLDFLSKDCCAGHPELCRRPNAFDDECC